MDSRNHGKNQNACHEIDTTCRAATVAPHKHTGVAGVEKPVPVKQRRRNCKESAYREHHGDCRKHGCVGAVHHASGKVIVRRRLPSSCSLRSTRTVSAGNSSSMRSGHSIRHTAPESK